MSVLANVPVGKNATVAQILGEDSISLRLLEMGLTPGVEVTVIGTAPLGDPMEIEVRGYRLSLRKTEAARISIQEQ